MKLSCLVLLFIPVLPSTKLFAQTITWLSNERYSRDRKLG